MFSFFKPFIWAFLLVPLVQTHLSAPPPKRDPRPNIIVILADDLGYSDIGCYGGDIQTPNLDKLAGNGVRLTHFYNTSRCCPSRASLLTGLYAHEAGVGGMVYENQGPGYLGHLNENCVTMGEVLGQSGYRTLMSGKWHVGHTPGVLPTDRGFQRFYGIALHVDSYYKVLEECPVYLDDKVVIPPTDKPVNALHPEKEWYTTDVFTDYALEFLKESQTSYKDKPFFLYLPYNAPHFPLEAPDEEIKKYTGKYLSGWNTLRQARYERMKKMGILPSNAVLSKSDATDWDALPDNEKRALDFRRAIYSAQVDRMDQNIGRLMEYLKKNKLLDNTLILFLSDNGASEETGMFGMNHPKYGPDNHADWKKLSGWSASQGRVWANYSNVPYRKYKRWVNEGGTLTPFIAHWPARLTRKGSLIHTPAHLIDLMATVCDVAQTSYPATYAGHSIKPTAGISLIPLLSNQPWKGHDYLYWEHTHHAAIRHGNMKLVSEDNKKLVWQLYDLQKDPTELHNLADSLPQQVQILSKKWEEWAIKADVLPWPADRKK